MKRMVWAMWAMLALAPALARAQQAAQKRAQVRQHISDYVVQRSTQELGLDANQAGRFREIWQRYDQQLFGVHQEHNLAMKELRTQLAATAPNETRLAQLADIILRDKAKVQQLEAQRTDELRRVMTALQFAKGITLAPLLQREVKEQMWRATHPNAPRPPDELE